MQALSGGPSTPIEQVTELGDGIIQKLVTAGITTVEALADMTPEQLEEIPGIGEKTLEKISVAVRHYFGHFEKVKPGTCRKYRASQQAECFPVKRKLKMRRLWLPMPKQKRKTPPLCSKKMESVGGSRSRCGAFVGGTGSGRCPRCRLDAGFGSNLEVENGQADNEGGA